MAVQKCSGGGVDLLDPSRLPDEKRCPRCGETKPAAEFGLRRRRNRGGTISVVLAAWCKDCDREDARKRMRRIPREQLAANTRRFRERDPRPRTVDRWQTVRGRESDITLEEYADWRERLHMGCKPSDWDAWTARVECPYEAWRRWLTEGAPDWWLDRYWAAHPRPWARPGTTQGEQYRLRYALDPEFNLRERVRSQFKKLGLGGMSNRRMVKKLGYSLRDLRAHIERQFTKGMSWDNYGEWHIDHITPKSSFDLGCPEEVRACWCLTNLRPLWAGENMRKGARRVVLC